MGIKRASETDHVALRSHDELERSLPCVLRASHECVSFSKTPRVDAPPCISAAPLAPARGEFVLHFGSEGKPGPACVSEMEIKPKFAIWW